MCAAHDDSLTLLSSDVLPPVFKLTALLATGYAVHRSLSPPNPPPAPKTCIDNRTLFERAIRHVTFCSKMMTWTTVLADGLVTIHLAFPSAYTYPLASLLLPSSASILHSSPSPASNSYTHFSPPPPLTAALTAPSLLLLLFALLAAAGALLRLACFRALGPLFTFELTIHPAHTLVTTGPYAHVRHPSYTGVFATLVGATGVMLAPGAWVREAWLAPSLSHAARWVIWLLSASATAAAASSPSLSSGVSSAWAPAGEWDAHGHGHGHGDVQGAVRVPALGALLAWAWVAFWLAKVAYAGRSTMRRVLTEDHELHRVFGPVWEEWAARVRWRLLPGVY